MKKVSCVLKMFPIRKEWKKVKRTGAFRRKVKYAYHELTQQQIFPDNNHSTRENLESNTEDSFASNDCNFKQKSSVINEALDDTDKIELCDQEEASISNEWMLELDDDDTNNDQYYRQIEKNAILREKIRCWAVSCNVPHLTLRKLFQILNENAPNTLPQDPRTLLKTPQTVTITKVGNNGTYWHHGLEIGLKGLLSKMQEVPKVISINVNMDGLPIFRSSKKDFGPYCSIYTNFPT